MTAIQDSCFHEYLGSAGRIFVHKLNDVVGMFGPVGSLGGPKGGCPAVHPQRAFRILNVSIRITCIQLRAVRAPYTKINVSPLQALGT